MQELNFGHEQNNYKSSNPILKYLTFWTNGNIYAVSTFDVLQIIEMTHVTSIPESPIYVKGILNIREHNIPIIDLGMRLDKKELSCDAKSRIILLSTEEGDLGIIVDKIDVILDLSEQDISEVPRIVDYTNVHLMLGIASHDKQLIPILNIPVLLHDEALEKIRQETERSEE